VWASQEGGALYDPSTGAEDPNTGYPNECLNSPEFPCSTSHTLLEYGYIGAVYLQGNNKDVGMLILDSSIVLDKYASIAAAGSVDALPVGTEITYSGYGASGEKPSVTRSSSTDSTRASASPTASTSRMSFGGSGTTLSAT
jgi:hypothetical protein